MYLHASHYYFSLLLHCYDAELHVTCSAECLVAVHSFLYLCFLERILKHSLSLNLHSKSFEVCYEAKRSKSTMSSRMSLLLCTVLALP